MSLSKWQGLKEKETGITKHISSLHLEELSVIEKLLDAYLTGFERIGGFTRTENNDLEYAWLLLITRSFNSMRCSHVLLERGYYNEALSLLRSVDEDWLIAKDCGRNAPTLEALLNDAGLLGRGNLTFSKMAEREGIKPLWDTGYGHLSRFAHPRSLSLKALVYLGTKTLRLGASYDRVLFLYCCEVLIRDALRMTEYMVVLLGSKASAWQEQTWPIVQQATDWLEGLQTKFTEESGSNDHQE